MAEDELEIFYQAEYRKIYQGGDSPNEKDLTTQSARAITLINYLEAFGVNDVSRCLDIGCSAGLLIEQFQIRYRCVGIGIEPGDAYRAYAKNRGLVVYPSLEGLKQAGEAGFDLISLVHVLEHLSDPVGYLSRLHKEFLSQDGRLLIEVPNLYAHDCFEVAHLSAFSEQSLSRTLRKCGFSVIDIKKHGKPRSELLPLYLTALAHTYCGDPTNTPSYGSVDRGVRFKRSAGMVRRRIIERLFPARAWIKS
jgi:SAM-dependent methyltransferase